MGTFIQDGAAVLPPVKTDARPASGATTEWASGDANKTRTALLDLRSQVVTNTGAIAAEQAARAAADAAIIASGAEPANVGIAPVIATGSTAVRTVADRFADVANVLDFGADRTGTVDSSAAFIAAIASLPSAGGRVYAPSGTYLWENPVATGSKVVRLTGDGDSTIIEGTGFALYTMEADGCGIENLMIRESDQFNGNASTVAVTVSNGASGIANWSIVGCTIRSGGGGGSRLGVGLYLYFALKGTVSRSNIEGWGKNVSYDGGVSALSNANTFIGSKIRQGTYGLYVEAIGIDSGFIHGSTIEGCDTGVVLPAGTLSLVDCHLENSTGATPTNVVLSGSSHLRSIGCGYYGAGENSRRDIVMSGSSTVASIVDTLNSGITNNSTGTAIKVGPILATADTGTGVVMNVTASELSGAAGGSGANYRISGFNALDIRETIVNAGTENGGHLKMSCQSGKEIEFLDHFGTIIGSFRDSDGQLGLVPKSGAGAINYSMTPATGTSGSATTWKTGATLAGYVKCVVGGNTYWMPFFDAPSGP